MNKAMSRTYFCCSLGSQTRIHVTLPRSKRARRGRELATQRGRLLQQLEQPGLFFYPCSSLHHFNI